MNFEVAVQGNLDPTLLFAPLETLEERAKKLLDEVNNKPGFIFNLVYGILPGTPEENVGSLVKLVQGKI